VFELLAVAGGELRQNGDDFDVGGLQIAVDDALLMRGFEGVGDLLGDRQHPVDRDRSARDPLRQVLAFDELHDQRANAVGLFLSTAELRVLERIMLRQDRQRMKTVSRYRG
jgi:hypothetical protein